MQTSAHTWRSWTREGRQTRGCKRSRRARLDNRGAEETFPVRQRPLRRAHTQSAACHDRWAELVCRRGQTHARAPGLTAPPANARPKRDQSARRPRLGCTQTWRGRRRRALAAREGPTSKQKASRARVRGPARPPPFPAPRRAHGRPRGARWQPLRTCNACRARRYGRQRGSASIAARGSVVTAGLKRSGASGVSGASMARTVVEVGAASFLRAGCAASQEHGPESARFKLAASGSPRRQVRARGRQTRQSCAKLKRPPAPSSRRRANNSFRSLSCGALSRARAPIARLSRALSLSRARTHNDPQATTNGAA